MKLQCLWNVLLLTMAFLTLLIIKSLTLVFLCSTTVHQNNYLSSAPHWIVLALLEWAPLLPTKHPFSFSSFLTEPEFCSGVTAKCLRGRWLPPKSAPPRVVPLFAEWLAQARANDPVMANEMQEKSAKGPHSFSIRSHWKVLWVVLFRWLPDIVVAILLPAWRCNQHWGRQNRDTKNQTPDHECLASALILKYLTPRLFLKDDFWGVGGMN